MARPETLVEATDVDRPATAARCGDQRRIDLQAFGFAEGPQRFEKQTVTAADIEDVAEAPGRCRGTQGSDQQLLPGPPPPMSLVELSVTDSVGTIHPCPREAVCRSSA